MLNPDWLQRHGQVNPIATGRGSAWFVDYQSMHWVLRRYLRGGMVARWNRQHYLGWRRAKSRAWREWALLQQLHSEGFPVPQPVAASVCWPLGRVVGIYTTAILLQRLPDVVTLAAHIKHSPLAPPLWQAVGQCIRRFHDRGVYHADLNADNILLQKSGHIYLIDFDRGELRAAGPWQQANLQRLKRSLLKLKGLNSTFYFCEEDWQLLLAGYAERISA